MECTSADALPRGALEVLHFAAKCYTSAMPTSRPRFTITETDDLARTLLEVARTHPELRGDRLALFRQLIADGAERYDTTRAERLVKRRAGIREAAGSMTGVWPADWRGERDAEWPD